MSAPLARVSALPGTGLIGIATAKAIGSRPERNRAARRFREAIRKQPDLADSRLDFILIVTKEGAVARFGNIEAEVRELFGRAKERWANELECS